MIKLRDLLKEELLVEKKYKLGDQWSKDFDYEGMLKKKVQKMSIDLLKNAKHGEWKKSSRNGIRAFAEMWDALAKYEEKKK